MEKQTAIKESAVSWREQSIRDLLLRPIKGMCSLYRNHEARLIALRVYDNQRN